MGKYFLSDYDAAGQVIATYIRDFEEALKIVRLSPNPQVVKEFQDRLHGLHALQDVIKQKGPIDNLTTLMWLPGDFNILARSVIEAGMTGQSLFDSAFDASGVIEVEKKVRLAQEAQTIKEARRQAEASRLQRLQEQQKAAERELALRLGISPERLAELQGQWRLQK